jgi:WD40 repeat protein
MGSGFQTWDLDDNDRHERRKSTLLPNWALSLALSPCGRQVALTTRRPIVYLWDLDSEAPREIRLRLVPLALAFRPDGRRLAIARETSGSVADSPAVSVLDVPSGALIEELAQDGDLRALAYSPDGRYLAVATADGSLTLRDAATHDVVGRRHIDIGELGPMAWLPDSSRLVVGGAKLIAVCPLDELLGATSARPRSRGEPLTVKASTSVIESLSYSPDGKKLLGWAPKSRMHIWDLSGGAGQAKLAARFKPWSRGLPFGASWSPDGERLALSFYFTSLVCDARAGVPLESDPLARAARDTQFAAFTPEGRLLVNQWTGLLSAGSTLVELYEADGRRLFGKEIPLDAHGRTVTHAEAAGGDRPIYLAIEQNGVNRWSPATGEVVRLFSQSARVTTLAVRQDERLALTVRGKSALLWTLPEGKLQGELKHPLTCSGAAFLPGGRVLTACYDGIVRLWDELN